MIKDIVKDVISKLYYALKARNTWALFGPEAGHFGYMCLLCGRQYKQLARHVAADHKYPRVRSTDVATTFAFPEDIDDALEEILAVPAARRQVLKSCKHCTESFVCKCRLGNALKLFWEIFLYLITKQVFCYTLIVHLRFHP